jgi:hypothetical protein
MVTENSSCAWVDRWIFLVVVGLYLLPSVRRTPQSSFGGKNERQNLKQLFDLRRRLLPRHGDESRVWDNDCLLRLSLHRKVTCRHYSYVSSRHAAPILGYRILALDSLQNYIIPSKVRHTSIHTCRSVTV